MPLWWASQKATVNLQSSWFFLWSSLPWIIWRHRNDLVFNIVQWPMEKTYQAVWDSLLDYGRLKWQRTLQDMEKALDVTYQDILREFDSGWCVKSLIVTRSNLVITWKIRPWMDIISWSPPGLLWFTWWLYFSFVIECVFNLCQKKNKTKMTAMES